MRRAAYLGMAIGILVLVAVIGQRGHIHYNSPLIAQEELYLPDDEVKVERELVLVSTEGNESRIISRTRAFPVVSWAPDAREFAVTTTPNDHDALHVVGIDTFSVTTVPTDGEVYSFQWSPDGSRLGFIVDTGSEYSIAVLTAQNRIEKLVTEPSGYASPLAIVDWRDAETLLFIDDAYLGNIVALDVRSGELTELLDARFTFGHLDVSADSRTVAWSDACGRFGGGEDGVWVADLVTGETRRAGAMCLVSDVSLSPRADQIAFTVIDQLGPAGGVYVADLDSAAVARLTTSKRGADVGVSWLPDGSGLRVYRDLTIRVLIAKGPNFWWLIYLVAKSALMKTL